ncbi:PAS domain S-box protein, partial [Candidatus Bathyarchaeota archaeon]|nr:PAS domain S-box protein [Candidatus Bathyarchaeota archaeon]
MKGRERHDPKEQELKEELERLRSLFDGIDEPIYVSDPDTYEILFANKKLKETFGEKILGKKCYKVFQNLNKPCPFCTNKYIFGENLGKTYIWEFQNRKNKRWYRCIDRAIKWPGGKYVRYEMAIDVTEHKLSDEILREREELFRSIVENSHNGILIIDDNFRFIYVNDELSRILGYPKEEIIGQDFRKFLDRESKALVKDRYLRRQRGENIPSTYEFKIVQKNGNKRDVRIKSTVIKDRQGRVRTVAQILDITEHKLFEERLSTIN